MEITNIDNFFFLSKHVISILFLLTYTFLYYLLLLLNTAETMNNLTILILHAFVSIVQTEFGNYSYIVKHFENRNYSVPERTVGQAPELKQSKQTFNSLYHHGLSLKETSDQTNQLQRKQRENPTDLKESGVRKRSSLIKNDLLSGVPDLNFDELNIISPSVEL